MFSGLRALAHSRDAAADLARTTSTQGGQIGPGIDGLYQSSCCAPEQQAGIEQRSSPATATQSQGSIVNRLPAQGGFRQSLGAAGGAQAPTPLMLSRATSQSNQHNLLDNHQAGLHPGYATALENARSQNYDAAAASFEELLQQQPGHVKAWISYAQARRKGGKKDGSRAIASWRPACHCP